MIVMRDKLIQASDKTCMKEKCHKKGWRWLAVDPDIPPIVYCQVHMMEFQQELFNKLE